jgi:hypothetical protein
VPLEQVAIRRHVCTAIAAHQSCASGLAPQRGQSDRVLHSAVQARVLPREMRPKRYLRAESRQFWSRLHTPMLGLERDFFVGRADFDYCSLPDRVHCPRTFGP